MFPTRIDQPVTSKLSMAHSRIPFGKSLVFSYKESVPNNFTKSLPCKPDRHFKFLSKLRVRVNFGSVRGGGTVDSDGNHSGSDSDDVFKPKKAPSSGNDTNAIPTSSKPHTFKCHFCPKEYFNDRSRRRHESKCRPSLNTPARKLIVCGVCNVGFISRLALDKHIKSCSPHSTRYTECVHPSCRIKFYTRLQMAQHLEREHLQDDTRKFLEFKDRESFLQWKKEEDMAKFMSTVKHRGRVVTEGVTYEYFCCNFDVKKSKKLIKHRVPDFKCPARLLIKQYTNDEKYHVQYIKSHPHELDVVNLQYHQYTKETLDFIKTNLDNGVNPHKIRQLLVPPDDGIEKFPIKEHFVSLRHIRKIHYNQLLNVQLHPNDAEAVKLLAKKMQLERNSVLVYKPQGEATVIGDKGLDDHENSSSLFAFGFQNDRMLNELKLAQSRVLCIDATHCTNKYNFYLLNLIVPDEYGHGYPVAHFICNSLDTVTLTSLFSNIRSKCPDLKVAAIMTDDDKTTWQAFSKVFGSDTIHLLCHWHIKRAWRKNLNSYIKDEELRNEIFRVLESLIEQKDSTLFTVALDSFISKYSAISQCANFIEYFRIHYANRPKLWAKCHRNFPHANTDTNMFCESFHSMLKRSGLHRKVNSRLDNLIEVLIKLEYNKHLDLKTSRTFKKPPIGMGDPKCLDRHNRGLKIPDAKVLHQIANNREKWLVQSATRVNQEHTVLLLNKTCTLDLCFVKCLQKACEGLCTHLYTCSCEDQVLLCKHIHKVHSMVLKYTYKTTTAKADDCADDCSDEWNMHTSPAEKHVPFSIDRIDEMTKTLIGWFHETESDLRNDDVRSNCVPYIYHRMKQVRSFINSVKAERISVPPIPTMDYGKIAPNQKAEKQSTLYRTTKKRRVQSPVLKHPTKDEQNKIIIDLLNLSSDCSDTDENDEQARTSAIIAALRRKLYQCVIRISDLIHISTIDLKSLVYPLAPSDLRSCCLVSSQFREGWLTDNVLDAFISIQCSAHETGLLMETTEILNVNGLLYNPHNNWFVRTNFENKSYIFMPSNPDGDHWMIFVGDLKSKKLLILDPLRTSKDLFDINVYGRKLNKERYDLYAKKFKELLRLKLGGNQNDWLVDAPEYPLQNNSYDCGVYVCRYVECFLTGQDLRASFNSSEYRKFIHSTILMSRPAEPDAPYDLNYNATL